MSEPKSFKQMWSQWDELKAKSRTEFAQAKEEIEGLEGWKFKGCPDGLIWRAAHRSSPHDVTARTAAELVAKVKKEAGVKT